MSDQNRAEKWINAGLAAATTAGSLYISNKNRKSQQDTNEADRLWQEQMYARQLADERSQWHLQNKYNSPQEQMKRFREAGLNPHLIYGQNNVGASMSVPGVGNWNPKAPETNFDPTSGIHAYNNIRQASAQVDNLKAQNTVLQQDAILRAAQTQKTVADTKMTDFDLGLKGDLRTTSMDAARANLEKTITENQIAKNQDQRAQDLHSPALAQAAAQLDLTKAQTQNLDMALTKMFEDIKGTQLDNNIKEIQLELWQNGVNPSDPTWIRTIMQYIFKSGVPQPKDVDGGLWKTFRNWILDKAKVPPMMYPRD